MNDFRKYATRHLGMNGLVFDEVMSAQAQYLSQLNTYWSYYYTIQRMTLYDYVNNENIECDFDELVK